jgi:hypothetical protein
VTTGVRTTANAMRPATMPATMPGPVPLYEAKADRSCLRCRLCERRRIPLGAVARHAAKHIDAGEAEPSGAHRAFGHAMRWRLTDQGTARWWATR